MQLPDISNKLILISALDWGFGHTTRCVSIIQSLIESQNRIIFAGNSKQNQFIRNEFPTIQIEILEGYNIELSSKKNTYFQVLKQVLKIKKSINIEFDSVKRLVEKYNVDLVLSDNRYGFRDSNIESIFIGHQLNLQLPIFKGSVNSYLLKFINKFSTVWIVDDEVVNLAGNLSKPTNLKIPYRYIGLISRFRKIENPIEYDYLIIVSGPAPENSIFLYDMELHAKNSNLRIAIVSTVKSKREFDTIDYFYNPTSVGMNVLLNKSKVIISKAGYTTLMELTILKKKTIFIPTKGQFEQEYLTGYVNNDLFTFINSSKDLNDFFN